MKKRRLKKTSIVEEYETAEFWDSKDCKNCGQCCGIIPAYPSEIVAITRYIKKNKIKPFKDRGEMCPFLGGDRRDPFRMCLIYPVRPAICRVFPHSIKMTCPHGVGPKIPEPLIEMQVLKDGETIETTLNQYFGELDLADVK